MQMQFIIRKKGKACLINPRIGEVKCKKTWRAIMVKVKPVTFLEKTLIIKINGYARRYLISRMIHLIQWNFNRTNWLRSSAGATTFTVAWTNNWFNQSSKPSWFKKGNDTYSSVDQIACWSHALSTLYLSTIWRTFESSYAWVPIGIILSSKASTREWTQLR